MTLFIPRGVLDEAARFFEDRGAHGREGTGMLASVRRPDGVMISRFLAPDQQAGTFPSCWVEVTRLGQYQLAVSLAPGQRWMARIHSHPGKAFHSPVDHANPGLTAEGAISIVVPYFGLGLRHGLRACALYQRRGARWVQTTVDDLEIELT